MSAAEGCKTTLDIASLAGFGTRCDAWGINVLGCPCTDGTVGTVQGCKKFPRRVNKYHIWIKTEHSKQLHNKTNLIIQSCPNWWCGLLNRRLTSSSSSEQRLLLLILQTRPLSCIIESWCRHRFRRCYWSTSRRECWEAATNCTSSSSSSKSWSRQRSCRRKEVL